MEIHFTANRGKFLTSLIFHLQNLEKANKKYFGFEVHRSENPKTIGKKNVNLLYSIFPVPHIP